MATWTNTVKSTTVYSNLSKNVSSWVAQVKTLSGLYFILLEEGSYLLTEDGFKFQLDDSSGTGTSWNNQTKN